MRNPWLDVPLSGHEGHMALPGIAHAIDGRLSFGLVCPPECAMRGLVTSGIRAKYIPNSSDTLTLVALREQGAKRIEAIPDFITQEVLLRIAPLVM